MKRKILIWGPMLGIFAALLIFVFTGKGIQSGQAKAAGRVSIPPMPDTTITVSIAAVGDLMCHSPQFNNARTGPSEFDFRPCFAEVLPYLSEPDFTIGNLETTLPGDGYKYSGYPRFKTPDEYVDAVQDAGFDFLVTSNNHSCDTDKHGILRTIEQLDIRNIDHTGTYVSQADRDSIRVVNVKGIRIAILNYTYGTNGIDLPQGMPWSVNLIDSALIASDMQAARKMSNVDLVMPFFHFGEEYQRKPGWFQKQVVDIAIANGADIILGAHPHVVQPAKFFKTNGGRLDTGFVAYSLGNFFSNQKDRYKDAGVILNMDLTKNLKTGKIEISEVSFTPTWVYKGTNPARKMHIIFPAELVTFDSLPNFLTEVHRKKLSQAYADTRGHFPSYDNRILEKSIEDLRYPEQVPIHSMMATAPLTAEGRPTTKENRTLRGMLPVPKPEPETGKKKKKRK